MALCDLFPQDEDLQDRNSYISSIYSACCMLCLACSVCQEREQRLEGWKVKGCYVLIVQKQIVSFRIYPWNCLFYHCSADKNSRSLHVNNFSDKIISHWLNTNPCSMVSVGNKTKQISYININKKKGNRNKLLLSNSQTQKSSTVSIPNKESLTTFKYFFKENLSHHISTLLNIYSSQF